MKKVYIFTGPVKSGKSTKLFNWVRDHSEVTGILSLQIDGKKHMYAISSKKKKCLETLRKNAINVGRFLFDPSVFNWAQKQMIEELNIAVQYLVIDEIGYLELKGEGLEPALSKILKAIEKRDDITLLLVVRNSLVNQVIEHYKLYNTQIIKNINEVA